MFFQEKPVLVWIEIDTVILCGVFFQEKPVLVRTPQAESKTIKRKLLHSDPTDDDGKWLVHLADLLATLTFSKHTHARTHARTHAASQSIRSIVLEVLCFIKAVIDRVIV